ncbi:hypothetical protein FF1_027203 [Malus domestica]|uniref:uncharacterized protein n=1 Tax=Malus domestica TaxID=3750 RepID=UPI0010AA1AE0|nr:uncharacterized protein LOC114820545 [Malus domestica]XP_050110857.1 uncharacterized protein LOC126589568 [Malus sylvestris]
MGICSSSGSTQVATAKLILQDGNLQEFPYPVKVSYVLQKNPTCFICNSDEMDFDDVLQAVSDNEVLQPGQLYFALPLSWLKHPLQAEEMAALAVKASSALMKSGGEKCGCRRNSVSPLIFSGVEVKDRRRVVASGGSRRRRDSGGNGRFAAELSAIPE